MSECLEQLKTDITQAMTEKELTLEQQAEVNSLLIKLTSLLVELNSVECLIDEKMKE